MQDRILKIRVLAFLWVLPDVLKLGHWRKTHLKYEKKKKKKFPGTKFLGTFGPPPTEKTEKIGKIKGTLVRKVPGNLRSQELVFFFLGRFFCPLNYWGIGKEHLYTLRAQKRLKKKQSRLKFSISFEDFNLDLQNSPPKKYTALVGGSLEISNLAWKFQSRRAILVF